MDPLPPSLLPRDSAIAISTFDKPVVMFPWWGAHSWVMTGYRADADPTLFDDLPVEQTVWMSHNDAVVRAPEGFRVTASTSSATAAASPASDMRLRWS